MFRPLWISSNSARPRSSEMRNKVLESLIVCLNHELHAWTGVSVIGHTVWRVLVKTDRSNSGVALLGGCASALVRSACQPQGQNWLPDRKSTRLNSSHANI